MLGARRTLSPVIDSFFGKLKKFRNGLRSEKSAIDINKAVIISQFLPRFDRTSADLRLYNKALKYVEKALMIDSNLKEARNLKSIILESCKHNNLIKKKLEKEI